MKDSKDFRKWIDFAESDWEVALIILNSHPQQACWHFQQAIEKYLKAILVKNGLKPPRTHDIDHLLALNQPLLDLNSAESRAAELIGFVTAKTRYPDDFVDLGLLEAQKVLEAAKILRDFARSCLELEC